MASFGHDQEIITNYKNLIEAPLAKGKRKAHIIGLSYGFSQFVTNITFGVLYYIAAIIYAEVDDITGEDLFVGLFAIIFGLYTAGMAGQFGADIGKAMQVAPRIFKFLEVPSKINAIEQESGYFDEKKFKGVIEFKKVWFRYPTRPNDWVFKGLSLKIN